MSSARMLASVLVVILAVAATGSPAGAASSAEIDREVRDALARMQSSVPSAKQLSSRAKAILVFPRIVKAGFLFGAQYGEGALRRQNRSVGYYNTVAASYGFQAGVQAFGYAMFFMSDSALAYLEKTGGFEIGTGPSVVILDHGTATTFTSTTMKDDIYAVFFDQRGLMAGMGLQGSKISRIDR